jgi:hypothetical protein
MFTKFNIKSIIVDHFSSFRHSQTKRMIVGELVVYFSVPLVFSLVLVLGLKFFVKGTTSEVLITSLSIFSALLFNLLLLIYDLAIKKDDLKLTDVKSKNRRTLLRETYNTIAFAIFESLITVLILLFTYLECPILEPVLKYVLSIISFFLVGFFLLTMLMILKRVHSLMSTDYFPKES